MSKKLLLVVFVVAVIVVGGGSFFAGMQYGKNSGSANWKFGFDAPNMDRVNRQTAGARQNMAGGGAGFIAGEVFAKDEQTLTIKMPDNSSKIIFFSTSTKVSQTIDGAINDIGVGEQVMVSGSQNADGSYTAQTIQQRPLSSQNQPQPQN